MTTYCLIWILLFFLLGSTNSQSTPVIGGQCQVGTPNYQIGGKQTQFFLKCEPSADNPNSGTWIVKSRGTHSAHPPATNSHVEPKPPTLRFQQLADTATCGQDLSARDGQPCNCPENCLQLDYSSAQCYLQCDSITRRWVRRSCQNGYVFSFEHQACIGAAHQSNYVNAQQQSLTQTLTQSLTQSQPQVQIQAQPTQQQTSQSSLGLNNAAGVVCSFRDCSSMKPCSVGTCNNGYCCSLTAANPLTIPFNLYSGCGSSCNNNNNYQMISIPSYSSCGTSCPRGYSGCCGTQQVSCCLRQICPGNLMPTGRSCFSSCPIGQICISGVCCPQINCPGGYQPNGVCTNGYCSAGFQCVHSLNMCCPVIMQTYSCPGGSSGMGSCMNGRCGNGYSCNSNSNQCCMDPTVCPDGTQAAGACVNNMCGQGYTCVKGLCCAAAAQTPKCLDGSQAVGACISGKCGMGYVCTTGNICCPSNTNVCPSGQVAVGPCINRMCPAGYTCYGTGPNAQCCGTENTNSINFTPGDAIGPCINGRCEADAECDTTQNLCFPILGAQIGPCIDDACPPGGYCVISQNSCYEWSGAAHAPPEEVEVEDYERVA